MRYVIYTDLDGTLLDENYSYEDAKPTINYLLRSNIPLIFCSSKTRVEIEVYRRKLGVNDPFISENGGAIFIPKDYFAFEYDYDKSIKGYHVIELGMEYTDLCKKLEEIREETKTNCRIVGFKDMTARAISRDCNLPLRDAELAKEREYDEAFHVEGTKEQIDEVLRLIELRGLNYTMGGRYHHIIGDNDKGEAVDILTGLYNKVGEVRTIGLGDSLNDLPMLRSVDIPVLVKKPNGMHDPMITLPNIIKIDGIGPVGWNKAINEIIRRKI